MEDSKYPNLQLMCRLCLKENSGTVYIFPKDDNENKFSALSIPMRIMTCAALEVQATDGLPSKLCTECRLQLEKSYYFRKQSQKSDSKLRKHIRLIGMGKNSKVFLKKLEEDDDDDDEFAFKDTLDFIKEQEDKVKEHEQLLINDFRNELRLQNEHELMRCKEALKKKCIEEVKPQIKKEVAMELTEEIQQHLEQQMRKQIKEECLKELKESLRNEIREECRQLEMKSLLDDLQTFLSDRKRLISPPQEVVKTNKRSVSPKIRPLSPTSKIIPPAKKSCFTLTSSQNTIQRKKQCVKEAYIMAKQVTEEVDESTVNDEETEADCEGNFLIYDTDDGFEFEKKSDSRTKFTDDTVADNDNVGVEEDEFVDSNSMAYLSSDEQIGLNEESQPTSTSYHIENNEHGDIKFLKKSNESYISDDNNVEQINEENIMIVNYPEELGEDNLDIEEYVQNYDKDVKTVSLKKELKDNQSPTNNIKPLPTSSLAFTTTSTTATLEATFLTKTYINPLQRVTDTPKTYKCDDCPMVFSTKPSWERHLRSHRRVEKTGITYQCPECQIVVSCGSALRRHMFIHCDEKPFVCPECGKAFVQKEILKRHMQTHTGIKPHQCPHCDRAFAQRINLTQHINRYHLEHPRIQQHSCHLCPKRFNHASGLSRHLASHSGVAFQCSECDRTFSDRSSIKRHIANMHSKQRVIKSEVMKSELTNTTN